MTIADVVFLILLLISAILIVLLVTHLNKMDIILKIAQKTRRLYLNFISQRLRQKNNLTDAECRQLLNFIIAKEELLSQLGQESNPEKMEKLKKLINSGNLNSGDLKKRINIKV